MHRVVINRHVFLVLVLVWLPLVVWADDFMSPGLSAEALQVKLGGPQAPLVVDLRKPAEFSSGHIPGAINIPLDELARQIDTVQHDNGVLIYCINGSRTRQAEPILYAHGFENIYHLEGAFYSWMNGKYPIEKGGIKKSRW